MTVLIYGVCDGRFLSSSDNENAVINFFEGIGDIAFRVAAFHTGKNGLRAASQMGSLIVAVYISWLCRNKDCEKRYPECFLQQSAAGCYVIEQSSGNGKIQNQFVQSGIFPLNLSAEGKEDPD